MILDDNDNGATPDDDLIYYLKDHALKINTIKP